MVCSMNCNAAVLTLKMALAQEAGKQKQNVERAITLTSSLDCNAAVFILANSCADGPALEVGPNSQART